MTNVTSTMTENTPPILVVTGVSGAGKTTALKALEDLGYEAVDNLPLSLIEPLMDVPEGHKLAIGIDVRSRSFSPELVLEAIASRRLEGRNIRVLYLDCAVGELVRRFSETRRRHPLALDRPASDGIAVEKEMLSALRRVADVVIDTTDTSTNDLRRAVGARFGLEHGKAMTITLVSFGYAQGVPRDADLVFDMRFLRNPHWVPDLRPKTGVEPAVRDYVVGDPAFQPAVDALMGLLSLLLPGYAREGRAYLTVAFGCTGGRHRSVATAEHMGNLLSNAGWDNSVTHRDRLRKAVVDADVLDDSAERREAAPVDNVKGLQ